VKNVPWHVQEPEKGGPVRAAFFMLVNVPLDVRLPFYEMLPPPLIFLPPAYDEESRLLSRARRRG
jgi:hypothetical protein